MTDLPKVLILGGGYAGLLAAARLSRSKRPLAVTLVDGRTHFEQRIRYHETLAGAIPKTLPYQEALARRGVGFCQGHVEVLDTQTQTVMIRQDGESRSLSYDYLLLALGSQAKGEITGANHTKQLLSAHHCNRQHEALFELAVNNGQVAVIGGGLTALECATEIKECFPLLNVTLVSRSALASSWSHKSYQHIRQVLQRLGITVKEQQDITAFTEHGLLTSEGNSLEFDYCLWAAGFQPAELAKNAKLPTDEHGRVLVNEYLQVRGHERIFVAGDLASVYAGQPKPLRMGCVTAMPQGAHAGNNLRRLLNQQVMQPFRFGHFFRCVSLGRHDGLIQYVSSNDLPLKYHHRGRLAVWIKEWVCRMTFSVLRWELKTGWALYTWPKPTDKANTSPPSSISSKDSHL